MQSYSASPSTTFTTAEAWTPALLAEVRAQGAELGFDAIGVAAAGVDADSRVLLDAERFASWVDAGRAGEMEYLKRRDAAGKLLRSEVTVAFPWARSVLVCALTYNTGDPRSIDPSPAGSGWIARYARMGRQESDGRVMPADYHHELLLRLNSLERKVQELAQCQARCYVDTGPIVERSLAARAGVGWIGKNTCVLNQELGSWLLLSAIVTSLAVPAEAAALSAEDRCGSCTRCIDACPTSALVAPREMDAARCIAYLTIEKKAALPEDLRAPMGRQVFGCDICQDVCPWNRRAPIAVRPELPAREDLLNPDLSWLAALTPAEFRGVFKGSPLERTGRKRLFRNVAVAMGNSGEARFLPQLDDWAAEENTDPVLAETARWAAARLRESVPASAPDAEIAAAAVPPTPEPCPGCSASIL